MKNEYECICGFEKDVTTARYDIICPKCDEKSYEEMTDFKNMEKENE